MMIHPHQIFRDKKIILASQSPRRRQLLEWAEVPFEIVIVPTDESFPNELPLSEIPVHIAKQKALAVQQQIIKDGKPFDIIIAADTIVVSDGKVTGKPTSVENAFEILSALSGKTHQVITGVYMTGKTEIAFSDITQVEFHELEPVEISYYIDRYQPFDKAGAYGIQEWIGVTGIKSISGDFYNVMGLPVSRVLQALKSGSL